MPIDPLNPGEPGVRYARTLGEIKHSLLPLPLRLDELDRFFEETADGRDSQRARRDTISEALDAHANAKVILFGHAGSGKSTELTKLRQERADSAFVIASLLKESLLSQASIEAILVLIADAVTRQFKSIGVDLNGPVLKKVYDWFSASFDIKEETLGLFAEAGLDADTAKTPWGKLMLVNAHVKADMKTGSTHINRNITKEKRLLAELAANCNALVREAQVALAAKSKRPLVIIVEDLDKVSLGIADEIFIQNPAPLADLACKAIYTAPIWLMSNPRAAALDQQFQRVTLPMIKVNEPNGQPCEGGRDIIRGLLNKRLDAAKLIDGGLRGDALTHAIAKTGGVLRHCFDVLATAAAAAEYAIKRSRRTESKILMEDVVYGLDQLKIDLVRRIGVMGLPPEYQDIKVADMLTRIKELADKPRKLDSDKVNSLLLMAHAIIEYNGTGWHAPHPLIADYVREVG